MANSFSFLDAKMLIIRPELFLQNLQTENFRNASELRKKQLHFWTHKSRKCALNFFCKPCKQRTSKMRLNFTVNSFVFGCKNCENAQNFLCKPRKANICKLLLNFAGNSFNLDAKIVKMCP